MSVWLTPSAPMSNIQTEEAAPATKFHVVVS